MIRRRIAALALVAAGGVLAPTVADAAPTQKWSEWTTYPADVDFAQPLTFPMCGTELTFVNGDEFEWQTRSRTLKDGTFQIQERGDWTWDIYEGTDLVPENLLVDELDISGKYTEETSPEGVTTYTLWGPAGFIGLTQQDWDVMEAAGLPTPGFWFQGGKLVFTADESGLIEITHAPTQAVDICDLAGLPAG